MLESALHRPLALSLLLALAPLLLQLPPLVAITVALTALLMLAVRSKGVLPAAVRVPLSLLALALVLLAFDFSFGRDTGCALLGAMLAIKPAETRSLRDARSLIGFALFAPFATFLLDQGPLSLLLGLAATVTCLLCMVRMADAESGLATTWRPGLRQVAGLLLVGLPLAMSAFWLFPRIGTPLWGIPERASAKIGLSDRMAPGDWIELMTDDTPAMRARFAAATPARHELYWRGPVLWDFDGRTWSGSREPGQGEPVQATSANAGWHYELEVEPSELHYLTALDLPGHAPAGSRQSPDGNLLVRRRLSTLTRWELHSAPPAKFHAELPEAERRRALRLPRHLNPRTQQLARQWHSRHGGNAEAIVREALGFITREFSYSLAPPPLGQHSVDEFLFQTRVGYCEHFSSAFVLLMRAAGVPARVVTGYTGGYFNPVGNYWVIRNSDAHAWVEVWLQGRGWVRTDPTAAVAPENIFDTAAERSPGQMGGGGMGRFSTRLWNVADYLRSGWNDFVLGFNAERQAQLLQRLGIERLGGTTLALLFAVAASLALLWMLLWLARGPRQPDPLLRAWHGLSRRYRRYRLERLPHETAADWLARVGAARPQDVPHLTPLINAFLALRYGHADSTRQRELVRAMRRYRPQPPEAA